MLVSRLLEVWPATYGLTDLVVHGSRCSAGAPWCGVRQCPGISSGR